jgi:hypothetical protein
MPNEDNEQWHLPAALRIDNPKVVAESIELQKRLKPKVISPFARLSPTEFARERAKVRVQHLWEAVKATTMQQNQHASHRDLRELRNAQRALYIRLAENYAILGEFKVAAEYDPRPEYQREYAKHF